MSQPEAAELRELLGHATTIAEEACRIARERLRAGFEFRLKADQSFVTEVDLAVEQHVRGRLSGLFPEHGILGEEYGAERAGSAWRWIVDPIDGTLSLRHRIPLFGTLLALEHEGEAVLGVLGLPELERVYAAARGLGAHCNGERLWLGGDAADGPTAGVLAVADRAQFVRAGRPELFDRLMREHPCVRTYPDAFGHALAVQGSAGAMVDLGIRRWDVAATEVLVREAGGRFERLGTSTDESHDVVFGRPEVVEWVLGLVRGEGGVRSEE
jgi:histidinol-phosphatase